MPLCMAQCFLKTVFKEYYPLSSGSFCPEKYYCPFATSIILNKDTYSCVTLNLALCCEFTHTLLDFYLDLTLYLLDFYLVTS